MPDIQIFLPSSTNFDAMLTGVHSLLDRSDITVGNFEICVSVKESDEKTLGRIQELQDDIRVRHAVTRFDAYITVNKVAKEWDYKALIIWPENAYMDGMHWNKLINFFDVPNVTLFKGNIMVPIISKATVEALGHVSAANNIAAYCIAYAHPCGILATNPVPVSSQDGKDPASDEMDMGVYSVQRCLVYDVEKLKGKK
jgi:hypothetical protein